MSLFNRISGGGGTRNNDNASNNSSKPVCKFYLEGRCRYGDQCRNYHPPRDQANQSFSQARGQSLLYHLNAESIKSDLTTGDERPAWPLSSYGPGRDAPRELLEGPIEQSPEELRVQYYLSQTTGSVQQYEQSEREALDQANQQAQRILSDMDGAIKYVIDGKDVHPNREDLTLKGPANFPWSQRPLVNQAGQSTGVSAFGQSSSFGSASSAFGQNTAATAQPTSTFGQPSAFGSSATSGQPQTAGSAFGQPSNTGQQTGGSAFGQASNLGSQSSPFGQQNAAFGAPSALSSAGSAFGKPSALGGGSAGGSVFAQSGSSAFGANAQINSTTQGSAFGQPSAPTGGSAFGRPSAFGESSGALAFGQSTAFGANTQSTNTGGSTFGQASAPGQQQSAFGQTNAPAPQQSAFGQPSAPSQQQSTFGQASSFGSAAAPSLGSAFGQPSQPGNQSAFGSSSPFNSSANGSGSTFGKPSAPAQQTSPFGSGQTTSPFSGASTTTTSTFGQPAQATAPSSNTAAASRPPGQPLTSWKGRPVQQDNKLYFYQNDTGRKERIWHPDGPPGPNPDVEATPPDIYNDGAIATVLKEMYDYVKQTGTFKDGLIPEIPPKREWVSFDL